MSNMFCCICWWNKNWTSMNVIYIRIKLAVLYYTKTLAYMVIFIPGVLAGDRTFIGYVTSKENAVKELRQYWVLCPKMTIHQILVNLMWYLSRSWCHNATLRPFTDQCFLIWERIRPPSSSSFLCTYAIKKMSDNSHMFLRASSHFRLIKLYDYFFLHAR